MCMSTGVAAMKIPDRPPMMNIATKAMALSIAEVYWSRPPHIVPSQLKTLMAEGRAIIIVESMKVAPSGGIHARLEHVVPPDDEAQPGDPGDGEDHRLVAEEGLAGEGRDDVRDHPHRRQDHDVDRRVRVEPEQVLEQERAAAADHRRRVGHRPADRLEEVRPGDAVEQSA